MQEKGIGAPPAQTASICFLWRHDLQKHVIEETTTRIYLSATANYGVEQPYLCVLYSNQE